MSTGSVNNWLTKLGYDAEPGTLHVQGKAVPDTHPYALELRALLKPDGAVRAKAVFDVEGVPTVVFVGDENQPLSDSELDAARQRIWNQNLATVVIEVVGTEARALPARRLANAEERLRIADARPDGHFSALEVATANLSRRVPEWFDVRARVDRRLLSNLTHLVATLTEEGFSQTKTHRIRRKLAELLVGQVLFLSYLEHREIVGTTYRTRRNVLPLLDLVKKGDRPGVTALIDSLCSDFNGDFLGDDRHDPWSALNQHGFACVCDFLGQTDLATGQRSFWNYDFSYIPVELLSGMYERFLTPNQQAEEGAYYTPRNLAMLAVDQALSTSVDPLNETIFDGACGSGILLTTAFRRLIALAESRAKKQLGFSERGTLLQRSIFGGDINLMACRVTAFSLYLSLMEGLAPADILEAQERDGAKLPTLAGVNLAAGGEGDFFAKSHRFARRQFSLVISNPPWAEPKASDNTSADEWAKRSEMPFVRRQIAGAFALRALDFLRSDGRVCLILPIGQLLGTTSVRFVAELLRKYVPSRLINFGDLQGLLFPTAENTCHIFVAERRSLSLGGVIPFDELFDYLVPKADLSLALGRLTMQSADRHRLSTRSVSEDPQLLVTMMWGDANDLALLTRLSFIGTFADFWSGTKKQRRWEHRKGIHVRDESRDAVSSKPLRKMPFVPVPALSARVPILHKALLDTWPEPFDTVVGLTEDLLSVFKGPRVLFPDGFSKEEQNIRSAYYDGPASFTHSIGVIAGPAKDAALLRFTAVYLRSTLARYFLMMRGWKMLCERSGFHLSDIEAFPFFAPDRAPNPSAAQTALEFVESRSRDLASLDELKQRASYEAIYDDLDEAVFKYFGLTSEERVLVRETVRVLMPSIRPRSFESLDTPAQETASEEDFHAYGRALGESLELWRVRMKGRGSFRVDVTASTPTRAGPFGIVRVQYSNRRTQASRFSAAVSDSLVAETLMALRQVGLRTIPAGDFLSLSPDTHVWLSDSLYLVRPLVRRSWTVRQALRDAEHIVRTVQKNMAIHGGTKAA